MYFKNKECCSTSIHMGLMTIMQFNVHSEYICTTELMSQSDTWVRYIQVCIAT